MLSYCESHSDAPCLVHELPPGPFSSESSGLPRGYYGFVIRAGPAWVARSVSGLSRSGDAE